MKINIFCKEEKIEDVKESLEEIGINIITSGEDKFTAEVSNEEYILLLEVPGIISVEKAGIMDLWRK